MIENQIRLSSDKKEWHIQCQPHIAIRLKRFFPKIGKWQTDTLQLRVTTENCRDLECILSRYGFEVPDIDFLRQQANAHKEQETIVSKLLKGQDTIELDLSSMKLPPREYQIQAAKLWEIQRGLLLGDEVGTGKTISAIAGLASGGKLPALVVTLTHLPYQWEEEIQKFLGLTTHILRKGQPYDVTKFTGGKFPQVLISNYHKLSGWASTLKEIGLKSVVFDEVHELRHEGSAKYCAAKVIADSVDFKLGLSATPIFNYGGEIFNVLQVIRPDTLGDYNEFTREWCTYYNQKATIKDPAAFGIYLRDSGLMLRRTRRDIQRELPPVTVVPHEIEVDVNKFLELQTDSNTVKLAQLILSKEAEEFKGQRMQAAGEFDIRLRQATGVAKSTYVAEFVKMLHDESQEKILLYGWHHAVYDVWMKYLKDLKPVKYTGQESSLEKQAALKAFTEGDSKVFIMSLRAGAGLNGLQNVCKLVVFGELDYSPAVHIQATGRIHRDGQDDPVVAYYLTANSGSDPVISDILGVKRQQLLGLNDPKAESLGDLQIRPDYVKLLASDYLKRKGIDTDY